MSSHANPSMIALICATTNQICSQWQPISKHTSSVIKVASVPPISVPSTCSKHMGLGRGCVWIPSFWQRGRMIRQPVQPVSMMDLLPLGLLYLAPPATILWRKDGWVYSPSGHPRYCHCCHLRSAMMPLGPEFPPLLAEGGRPQWLGGLFFLLLRISTVAFWALMVQGLLAGEWVLVPGIPMCSGLAAHTEST